MGFNRFFGASVLSLAILAGCGGGGGDSSAPAAGGGGGTTTSGQLTNSPIDGVGYSAAPSGLTGTTMNGGMFNFQAGDTVTFNIAGLEIDVPGGTRITPQTIAESLAAGNAATQSNILANLATLFQTLDNDGDPENGSIAIREGATLGNTAALLANLDEAPATFQGELSTAISSGEELRDEGEPPPTVVTDVEAMLRFYRNELQGNWRLVSSVEEGVTTTTNANYQVLLSFDVGNANAAEDGIVNSFVFSEYDITDSMDPFAFIGVGTTNYNGETGEFQFTSLPMRRLVSGFNNSSTENDAAFFTSKIVLSGNQLELTLIEDNITIVATFERFNSVKDSLVGTWYEVFAEGDPGVTPTAAPDNGRVTFGSDVASVFYYFLSGSRVMLVFTDLDAEMTSDERNGVVLANYSLNSTGTSLTFTDILLDTVSVDPVNNPALEAGLTVAVSAAMLNDTNRELTDSSDPNETDVFTIFRILSLSERVGEFEQAAPAP
ncbi:hypothetical protein [uncultured Limnobacter sp.]|jgi:hypothetical protein|uniref:hypothetical protein n=1 Tax=uncultured Limnobacter sp. TaxID=199681 RepID=UPI0030F84C41